MRKRAFKHYKWGTANTGIARVHNLKRNPLDGPDLYPGKSFPKCQISLRVDVHTRPLRQRASPSPLITIFCLMVITASVTKFYTSSPL